MNDYDRQARRNGWYPEALFGLVYEYLHPGDRLLDAGIGTGLSSEAFARAGVQVFGLDSDREMLALCRAKAFVVDLRQHDLLDIPWPYETNAFDHVLCFGVLHFLADLEPVFGEAGRLLRPGGTFTFTTKAPPARPDQDAGDDHPFEETIQGVTLYLHSGTYLERLMAESGFELLKELRLVVRTGRDTHDIFCALVARKMQTRHSRGLP